MAILFGVGGVRNGKTGRLSLVFVHEDDVSDGGDEPPAFDRFLVCLKLNSSVYPGQGFPYIKQRLHVGLASSHCREGLDQFGCTTQLMRRSWCLP